MTVTRVPRTRALLQAAALFEDALEKEGLQRIVADGAEFDPSSHEAVEHLPADEDAGTGTDGGADAGAGADPVRARLARPSSVCSGPDICGRAESCARQWSGCVGEQECK